MNENIPKEILKKAKEELDFLASYGHEHAGEMRYLGERDGVRYYTPYYPDAEIGYPTVYSINDKGKCSEIKGQAALDIAFLLFKQKQ